MLSNAGTGRGGSEPLGKGAREVLFRPGVGGGWCGEGGRERARRVFGGERCEVFGGEGEDGGKGGRRIEVDVGSNGAVALVLQALLPVVVWGGYVGSGSGSELTPGKRVTTTIVLSGGTNVSFSPSCEYLSLVLIPTLVARLGVPGIRCTIEKRAWAGSTEMGRVRVEVEQLGAGEGVRGFVIEADRRVGERVGRVGITVVVPTEREVRVWSEIARGMVKAAGVRGWRVPPPPPPSSSPPREGEPGVDGLAEELKTAKLATEVDPELEIEITHLTTSTLPPRSSGASGVGGANAQGYYALMHTVSSPSGYIMGYDSLHTAPQSAKLPGLVGALDSKRTRGKTKAKGRGGKGKATANKRGVWPPPEEKDDGEAGGSGEEEDDSPEMVESRILARRMLGGILRRLKEQWGRGEVVDEYLRDQLVVWQALGEGWSYVAGGKGREGGKLGGQEIKVPKKKREEDGEGKGEEDWGSGSLHTQTARWIAKEVVGVEWEGEGKGGCWGAGLKGGESMGWGKGGWEERMKGMKKKGEVEEG